LAISKMIFAMGLENAGTLTVISTQENLSRIKGKGSENTYSKMVQAFLGSIRRTCSMECAELYFQIKQVIMDSSNMER